VVTRGQRCSTHSTVTSKRNTSAKLGSGRASAGDGFGPIASGRADAGLGILPAAQAMDLDFIPIAKERYDLVIPSIYFKDEKIEKVMETIRSEEFKKMVFQLFIFFIL
jgi:molybdate-binding protein